MNLNSARIIMKNMAIKILNGVGFGLGASFMLVISISIFEEYRHDIKSWFSPKHVFLNDVKDDDLKITFHKQRTDTEKYTIVGTVKNNSKYRWKEISIKASLFEKNHQVASCWGNVEGWILEQNQESFFLIKCDDTLTQGVSYKYKIKINSAYGY